jgi:hypothetical protein
MAAMPGIRRFRRPWRRRSRIRRWAPGCSGNWRSTRPFRPNWGRCRCPSDPATRLSAGLAVDLATLRQNGCRVVQVSGRDVYEVCFARDGGFHLYVAARADWEAARAGLPPEFVTQGGLASASWADDRYVYVAVTKSGEDALRRIL